MTKAEKELLALTSRVSNALLILDTQVILPGPIAAVRTILAEDLSSAQQLCSQLEARGKVFLTPPISSTVNGDQP